MFEQYKGQLIVIAFRNGTTEQRTIARLVDEKEGFLTLEAPTKKNQYFVNLRDVITLTLLSDEKIKPEFKR